MGDTPKYFSKPVSSVFLKIFETTDSLKSSSVSRPPCEPSSKRASSLNDFDDESQLESFSPTSDRTCTSRIGLGCTSCTKSSRFWRPLKLPSRWEKFLKN